MFINHLYLIIIVTILFTIDTNAMHVFKLTKKMTSLSKPQFHTARAKEFLSKVTQNTMLPDNNTHSELVKYLQDRMKNSAARGKIRTNELNKILSSEVMLFFVINKLDTHSAARIVYYFPKMVEGNLVFRIRKELGCYTQDLTEHDQPHSATLQQVTDEEYSKKLKAKFTKNDLETMMLEESKELAKNILLLINASKM